MPVERAGVGAPGEGAVDLVDARRPLGLDGQVDDRARRQRDAHGVAVSLPASSGITSPSAFAAPVDVGIRFSAAARARRRSLCGRRGGSGRPCRRGSSSSGRPDAERLVQDRRHRGQAVRRAGGVGDDVVASGSYGSSLTPITMFASAGSSPLAGAVRITLRAPASRCGAASAWVRKRPVASITTSTPRAAHGSVGRLALGSGDDPLAVDSRQPSRQRTAPGKRP